MTGLQLLYADGTVHTAQPSSHNSRQRITQYRASRFPVGTRVKLIALAQTPGGYDDSPNLPPGSTGTVKGTPDAFGSLPITWDHGSSLAATADDVLALIQG